MRKLLYMVFVFTLCAGLLAGCEDGKKSGPDNSDADNANKEYTVTITAPEGWESISATGTLFRYRKSSGDFWVKQSPSGGSVESSIAFYKDRESQNGYDFVWEDIKDEKVNGMDAKYLKYTVDTGSIQMRYDAYFIKMDASLFTVVCLTSPVSDYSGLESDYKALLDSLNIAEK